MNTSKTTNELLKKVTIKKIIIKEKNSLTAKECLELIEYLYSDRVEIIDYAWKTAETSDKYLFKNTEKLLDLLVRLLTDYLDKYIEGGDNLAKGVFSNNEYAAQDNDSKMARRGFPQHLKIGVAHNQKFTARVHFKVDRDKNNKEKFKITIAHCGQHL